MILVCKGIIFINLFLALMIDGSYCVPFCNATYKFSLPTNNGRNLRH